MASQRMGFFGALYQDGYQKMVPIVPSESAIHSSITDGARTQRSCQVAGVGLMPKACVTIFTTVQAQDSEVSIEVLRIQSAISTGLGVKEQADDRLAVKAWASNKPRAKLP